MLLFGFSYSSTSSSSRVYPYLPFERLTGTLLFDYLAPLGFSSSSSTSLSSFYLPRLFLLFGFYWISSTSSSSSLICSESTSSSCFTFFPLGRLEEETSFLDLFLVFTSSTSSTSSSSSSSSFSSSSSSKCFFRGAFSSLDFRVLL